MTLDIESVGDGATLGITDRIERRQVSIRFPSSIDPIPATEDAFVYPVDRAVSVTTDAVTIEGGATATVLDPSGTVQANINEECWTDEITAGEYYLDVSSHVKTYLRVETAEPIRMEYDSEASLLEVDFGEETEVVIGARSTHERPEATITTTTAPEDVMAAVSYLGSALKDDGRMRSFPTLRGHPPEIELGDELRIPDRLERPETGVTIEVPPSYEYVYPVASLAYYFGATVVPGEDPRLLTDAGFEYALEGPGGFEATVERVLKQVFTCDCYVRSGGPFSYDLARREEFVAETGLDPEEIYDAGLAAQVETYLGLPFETVEPYVPEWGLGAHLEAMPDSVEYLPNLSNDLAIIHSPEIREPVASSIAGTAGTDIATGEFTRSAAASTSTSSVAGPDTSERLDVQEVPTIGDVESASLPALSWPGMPPSVVHPASLETQEQRWIGAGIPLGADKPRLSAFRNALDRDPVEGEIEILVVCNDDRMAEENESVQELLDGTTPFDVCVRPYRNVRIEELRDLLECGGDFLHYIGHIDERGVECSDGYLDTRTLDAVNVDAFFLNACGSYAQGRGLIDAGAIAGVVTLDEVRNSEAATTGRTVASLLNDAFPLDAALRVASEEHGFGDQYTVVGDGTIQIVQAESNAHLLHLEPAGSGMVGYCLEAFVTPQFGMGAAYAPTMEGIDGWYLFGDHVETSVPWDAIRESIYEDVPVRIGGELRRANDLLERLDKIDPVREELDELIGLTFDGVEDAAGGGVDPERRRRDLREGISDAFTAFDSDDFRAAYQVIAFDGTSGREAPTSWSAIDSDDSGPSDRPR